MEKKGHNECPFSDEIVSYMYGEMPDGAQLEFEQHLVACQVCTDDFAAVSVARFEAYDWKRIEFDALETPRIVIPYPEHTISLGERVSGWLTWVTVVPAVAVLVITLGVIGLYLRNRSGNSFDTAGVNVPAEPSARSTGRPPIVDPRIPAEQVASKISKGGYSVRPQAVVAKRKRPVPISQFARRITPGVKLANDLAVNITANSVKRPPRLGMNDPDEDRSLRLADLFDETNPPPQR
jgi:hypothetical protein